MIFRANTQRDEVEVVDGDGFVIDEWDRYEALGHIADITTALADLWPEPEKNWDRDPQREDLSGRIGQKKARQRSVRK